eukprot:1157403-Pelagomonas_calceolata.AAC.6
MQHIYNLSTSIGNSRFQASQLVLTIELLYLCIPTSLQHSTLRLDPSSKLLNPHPDSLSFHGSRLEPSFLHAGASVMAAQQNVSLRDPCMLEHL